MAQLVVSGWTLFAHDLFHGRLDALLDEVERLEGEDPASYFQHPTVKLFIKVDEAVRQNVPRDPKSKSFVIGQTLGASNGHWRRVKNGLPQRYRLFFLFSSQPPQSIIYAWLNDDTTLRKQGARTDVYAVFKRMLDSGSVPNTYDELRRIAVALPEAS